MQQLQQQQPLQVSGGASILYNSANASPNKNLLYTQPAGVNADLFQLAGTLLAKGMEIVSQKQRPRREDNATVHVAAGGLVAAGALGPSVALSQARGELGDHTAETFT